MGYPSPAFCNPATFFMKCMNPEGVLVDNMQKQNNYSIELTHEMKHEFKQRVEQMVTYYKSSKNYKEILPNSKLTAPQDEKMNTVNWITQYSRIWYRGVKNNIRNPMDFQMKLLGCVFMAFVIIIVFSEVNQLS